MNILFLCIDMEGLHGSFLHVMEYADFFRRKGWHVTIGSVYIAKENREMAESCGFEVYRINEIPDIEYDLVYALHLFLFPYLLIRGLKYKKAITASLSAYVPIEQIPIRNLLPMFDLVTAISQEVVNVNSKKFDIKQNIYTIVPNHIPVSFMEKCDIKNDWNTKIEKICVISNHYIQKMVDLKQQCDFQVDLIGMNYNNTHKITPEFLANYDVIITIGKTVQYGMGLGIPVYQYDLYGGCGYITPQNLLAEERTNFSGRGTRRELSVEQIIQELQGGYGHAVKQAPQLKKMALERYSIDKLIGQQLQLVDSHNAPRPKLTGDALLFANASLAAMTYFLNKSR